MKRTGTLKCSKVWYESRTISCRVHYAEIIKEVMSHKKRWHSTDSNQKPNNQGQYCYVKSKANVFPFNGQFLILIKKIAGKYSKTEILLIQKDSLTFNEPRTIDLYFLPLEE